MFVEIHIFIDHRHGFQPICINKQSVLKFEPVYDDKIGAKTELLIEGRDGREYKYSDEDYAKIMHKFNKG